MRGYLILGGCRADVAWIASSHLVESITSARHPPPVCQNNLPASSGGRGVPPRYKPTPHQHYSPGATPAAAQRLPLPLIVTPARSSTPEPGEEFASHCERSDECASVICILRNEASASLCLFRGLPDTCSFIPPAARELLRAASLASALERAWPPSRRSRPTARAAYNRIAVLRIVAAACEAGGAEFEFDSYPFVGISGMLIAMQLGKPGRISPIRNSRRLAGWAKRKTTPARLRARIAEDPFQVELVFLHCSRSAPSRGRPRCVMSSLRTHAGANKPSSRPGLPSSRICSRRPAR